MRKLDVAQRRDSLALLLDEAEEHSDRCFPRNSPRSLLLPAPQKHLFTCLTYELLRTNPDTDTGRIATRPLMQSENVLLDSDVKEQAREDARGCVDQNTGYITHLDDDIVSATSIL